jgi:hypothetical protein
MSTDLVKASPADIEKVIIGGDLSKLSPQERTSYYMSVCDSLNLNPLTKPFEYINLNGKLTLYATRNCAEQLRKNNGVSVTEMTQQTIGDVLMITVKGVDKTGRSDVASGAVCLGNLKGEALCNAYLKCETKAKRRLTLSICGLGMLDETEVDSIPNARKVDHPAPQAEQLPAPVPSRPKFGQVIKSALNEYPQPIPAFTSTIFNTMSKFYRELDGLEDQNWKMQGEAMAKLYDSMDDSEKDEVIATIRDLAMIKDKFPEAELVEA